jgi:hypothetical protein
MCLTLEPRLAVRAFIESTLFNPVVIFARVNSALVRKDTHYCGCEIMLRRKRFERYRTLIKTAKVKSSHIPE